MKFDSYLLDNVFQPISTWIYRYVNPLEFSMHLFILAFGLAMVKTLNTDMSLFLKCFAVFIVSVYAFLVIFQLHHTNKELSEGTRNPLRFKWGGLRVIVSVVTFLFLYELIIGDFWNKVNMIGNFIEIFALYIGSTDKIEPPKKTATLYAHGAA